MHMKEPESSQRKSFGEIARIEGFVRIRVVVPPVNLRVRNRQESHREPCF